MTLLEVMVALMIFAIGCLALINSTGGQVRSLSEIEAKTVALWVADNQLMLLQLDPQPPTLAWHSGTTVMAGEAWHWRYRGQETSDAGMRAIAIEVRRDPQDRNVLAELQAYRGLP
ncbi:TPA: type II secretion system minor pseudopilin GspI [Serratia marcescens]